jgi:hypothetical protein
LRRPEARFETPQLKACAGAIGLSARHGPAGAQFSEARHLLHDADALHRHLVAIDPKAIRAGGRHILDRQHQFRIGQRARRANRTRRRLKRSTPRRDGAPITRGAL